MAFVCVCVCVVSHRRDGFDKSACTNGGRYCSDTREEVEETARQICIFRQKKAKTWFDYVEKVCSTELSRLHHNCHHHLRRSCLSLSNDVWPGLISPSRAPLL